MALGNDLVFGVLRGLRVVERPRSGGPLRKVGAPAPASGSSAADASSSGATAPKRSSATGEKVQISSEARAMAERSELRALKQSDQQVRQHEHAHQAAGAVEGGAEILERLPVGGLLA